MDAKSIILDIADNWGDATNIALRQVDFWSGASKITLTTSDFTAYHSSVFGSTFDSKYAFDTSTSKTGTLTSNGYLTANSTVTNTRIICVFDTVQTFDKIVINNGAYATGNETDKGARNVKIHSSTDSISDTTYNAAISNSTLLFDGEFDEHVASNVEDPQDIIIPGESVDVVSPELIIPIEIDSKINIQISVPEIEIPVTVGIPIIFVGVPIVSPEVIIPIIIDVPIINIIVVPPELIIPIEIDIPIVNITIIPPETTIGVNISVPTISTFSMSGSAIRYFLTVTGSADSTTDIELPMSSFQARRKSGEATYLSVVIPTLDYSAQITARSNGTIKVEQGYSIDGEVVQRELILEAEIDNIKLYEGGRNQSIVLDGYKTTTYTAKAVTLSTATYKALSDGKIRYRVAEPNIFLNPGDTVTIGLDVFEIGVMSYVISPEFQQIELKEA